MSFVRHAAYWEPKYRVFLCLFLCVQYPHLAVIYRQNMKGIKLKNCQSSFVNNIVSLFIFLLYTIVAGEAVVSTFLRMANIYFE